MMGGPQLTGQHIALFLSFFRNLPLDLELSILQLPDMGHMVRRPFIDTLMCG